MYDTSVESMNANRTGETTMKNLTLIARKLALPAALVVVAAAALLLGSPLVCVLAGLGAAATFAIS